MKVLTVPGLGNSGPQHWQTRWEAIRPDTSRVELCMWTAPLRNPWVTKLEQSIRSTQAPVILVAHSLGCLTVAWWAALAAPKCGHPVAAALLVAPPHLEPDSFPILSREFARLPLGPLPFPTIVAASHDDPYATFDQVAAMATGWGAHLVDAGSVGHINAASGLGVWTEGIALLDRLTRLVETGGGKEALADIQDHYARAAADWSRENATRTPDAANPQRI
ncbi:alpha/beta hydrolase [soil metagenome]